MDLMILSLFLGGVLFQRTLGKKGPPGSEVVKFFLQTFRQRTNLNYSMVGGWLQRNKRVPQQFTSREQLLLAL